MGGLQFLNMEEIKKRFDVCKLNNSLLIEAENEMKELKNRLNLCKNYIDRRRLWDGTLKQA